MEVPARQARVVTREVMEEWGVLVDWLALADLAVAVALVAVVEVVTDLMVDLVVAVGRGGQFTFLQEL